MQFMNKSVTMDAYRLTLHPGSEHPSRESGRQDQSAVTSAIIQAATIDRQRSWSEFHVKV